MNKKLTFSEELKAVKRVIKNLPRDVGRVAVSEFQQNFIPRQGFFRKKWAKRKGEKDGHYKSFKSRKAKESRATLIKSGDLRRSIRIISVSSASVQIGTNVPYAQAHNEGFKGTVNQKVQQHTRKAHTRKGRGRKKVKVPATTVKAHNRTIQQNIPQRQFIGNDQRLEKKLSEHIENKIEQALKI